MPGDRVKRRKGFSHVVDEQYLKENEPSAALLDASHFYVRKGLVDALIEEGQVEYVTVSGLNMTFRPRPSYEEAPLLFPRNMLALYDLQEVQPPYVGYDAPWSVKDKAYVQPAHLYANKEIECGGEPALLHEIMANSDGVGYVHICWKCDKGGRGAGGCGAHGMQIAPNDMASGRRPSQRFFAKSVAVSLDLRSPGGFGPDEEGLHALRAENERLQNELKAARERLRATEERLRATEEQVKANEEELECRWDDIYNDLRHSTIRNLRISAIKANLVAADYAREAIAEKRLLEKTFECHQIRRPSDAERARFRRWAAGQVNRSEIAERIAKRDTDEIYSVRQAAGNVLVLED